MTELTIDAIRKVIREETSRPVSPWLDTSGAAAYLGSTAGTLKNWRAAGIGPAYHIMQERLVRYHADDLDRFVRTGGR
ncbi:helix-turn-helix domain-containing protein [Pseudoblastomonas halimionae]|uniref:DNA-binding protein n=1 Tax=Alteriqipengyuania halimionae TaxID=1926630 RepID=A0A6I4U3Y1_9SPHN|nr:helix-turn-helix domain-containing protein [Alteriqipengyuania halimionae]MXP09623.1 DNA-binding protein [Alteriqipengyuania halimionae]